MPDDVFHTTRRSGATFSVQPALSFLHLENVRHVRVEVDKLPAGEPFIVVLAGHMIGDFACTDTEVLLSLGHAAAIGEVAAAELARIAEKRDSQREPTR